MTLQPDAAYLALKARDARFDGRLFVGVTSTGIYCRPICRVRTPRPEHCRFYPNAACAERDGFRPCLRCRPELAPGLSLMDSSQVLAQHAARLLDGAARDGHAPAVSAVAAQLGVTDRHLRRIFVQEHGVSPVDYLTTQRLLLAKQLLTDTRLPITQVALASGFGSVRRFNAAFSERYRLQPGALRRDARSGETTDTATDALGPARTRPRAAARSRAGRVAAEDAVTLRLGYRPPYDVEGVLRYFGQRALVGVESVDGGELRRTLTLTHAGVKRSGWFCVRFDTTRHEAVLRLAPSLAPAAGAVVQRVRQGLDLDADPSQIDPVMALLPGVAIPGLRVPNGFDGFEIAARVILGQQVSVAAARTLAQRLVDTFGPVVATPFPLLTRGFPSAATIAAADPETLGGLGIVRQRVKALQALAQALQDGRLALHRGVPLETTLEQLQALPGIGPWSVQLIALRALAWPDAFPASDIGVLNALGHRDPVAAEAASQAWRPWRAYAVMRLWRSLETGT